MCADNRKGIGAQQDAARMHRVVSFYEKLPRGPAPDPKPKGLLQRYQARYMGKNASAMRRALRQCYMGLKIANRLGQPLFTSLAA